MSIESALYDRLAAASGLTALVSARIYPLQAPQGDETPYVVWQRIGGRRIGNLAGASRVALATFQVACYATTFLAARAVADQVRYALNGYNGTQSGQVIRVISIAADRDDIDFSEPATPLYRAITDYLVPHEEATS